MSVAELKDSRVSGNIPIGRFPDQGDVVPVLTPEQIDAWAILDQAATKQERLVASGRYARYRGLSGQAFFRAFLNDSDFENLYQEAQEIAVNFEDDWIFARKFKGALFERIALAYLGSLGLVVLSGESAFNVCKALNPDAKEFDNGFVGQKGLEGVYIPDGLHIARKGDVPVVEKVLESSSANGKVSDQFQFSGFKSLRRQMGVMAAESKFVHVSPKFENPIVYPYEGVKSFGKPTILPFTSDEFRDRFEPAVYWNFRRPGERTLAEIREGFHNGESDTAPRTLVDPRIA